jgi:hypothetical protein
MRQDSIPFHGQAVLAAVMIFSGSCIATDATAESEFEPARLVTLSGTTANYLRDNFNPAMPEVLRASVGESPIALVFDKDPQGIFSPDSPPGCVDEGGVLCCDPETKTLFLSVTYDGQPGWAQTGELCEAPRAEAAGGVPFVPIPDEVSRELSALFNVTSCFMPLPQPDGEPRILVNAPSEDSWRWSYCFNRLAELDRTSKAVAGDTANSSDPWLGPSAAQPAKLGGRSAVVLAGHHGTPPPPDVIYADPPRCPNTGTDVRRCHRDTWHLFYKDGTVSYPRWTAVSKCECPS